jgi:hypothetical protein
MRQPEDLCRLSFLLPDGIDIEPAINRYEPAFEGCDFAFHSAGLLIFSGRSREAIFVDVSNFLHNADLGSQSRAIHATMTTERDETRGMPSGRDSWTIMLPRLAFLPTSIEPQFAARSPPALLQSGET